MNNKMGAVRILQVAAAVTLIVLGADRSFGAEADFTVTDFIGRDWANEVVQFPMTAAQAEAAQAGQLLVGDDGKPVSYQVVPGEGSPRIAFQTDLPADSARSFHFSPGGNGTVGTDLRIEESTDSVHLVNSKTGVQISKSPEAAPIQGFRLGSDEWVGGSALNGATHLESCTVEVIARGPVFAEVVWTGKLAGGGEWEIKVRMEAGEPVVLFSETFSGGEGSGWTLDLSKNFAPTDIFYRRGKKTAAGNVGEDATWKIAPPAEGESDPAFLLEPWLHWWERDRQGLWLGLYNASDARMLVLAALHPGVWVDPAKKNVAAAQIPLTVKDGVLSAAFGLNEGRREWMIAALDKTQSLSVFDHKEELAKQKLFMALTPLPQQYLIKHGDFPLDLVKDYVLEWPEDPAEKHPRLLVTADDLARWKERFQPKSGAIEKYLSQPITENDLNGPVETYLATGDEKLGRHLAEAALQFADQAVKAATVQEGVQDGRSSLGFGPHMLRCVLESVNVSDAVWDLMTPDERKKLRASYAFLAYTYCRPDYWSPERGYSGNPNMSTARSANIAGLSAAISSHPQAKTWNALGMAELKDEELDLWADSEGGWLEAPGYALYSYHFLVSLFLMSHNAGLNDFIFEPKMQKIADWFAQISTPPDSRIGGTRHLLPLGNTNVGAPSAIFGILADIWKDRDPAFAARMQWMYKQHGEYDGISVGGRPPALLGYEHILLNPAISPVKPDYKSILFPETGVLLRNGVDDRETQLHMIAGPHHAHYDDDSGSVTIWGKGRVVADEFGYYGLAQAEDHNMVQSPLIGAVSAIMKVGTLKTLPNFDYLEGKRDGWTRRIAFVKDSDLNAPNYFVIKDSFPVPVPATWRMWFAASDLKISGQSAQVIGRDDVDTDITFLEPLSQPLKSENRTRTSAGLNKNRQSEMLKTTLTGLIAEGNRVKSFTTVIYPRLKSQKPPVVTTLAEGKVIKVVHESGTDYVLLDEKPFVFQGEGIKFQGTCGLVKIRGRTTEVALGQPGEITAHGQSAKLAK